MNTDQVMSLVRTVLKVGGAVAVTVGVGSSDQIAQVSSAILDIAGGVSLIVGLVMSWKEHK